MALIIKGRKPTGCFDCDYCDKRAYFDGNEWHLGCRLLCMEVSDDGETDEKCPIIGEIPDRHGDLIDRDKTSTQIIAEICQFCASAENGNCDGCLVQKCLEAIGRVPVIVEATE